MHPDRYHDHKQQHSEHNFERTIATVRRNTEISFNEMHAAFLRSDPARGEAEPGLTIDRLSSGSAS